MSDLQTRFIEQIKLRGLDDRFIDKQEEKEILSFAISEGVTLDKARLALKNTCLKGGFVLESYVEEVGAAVLKKALDDGMISKKEFDGAIAEMLKAAKNKLSDPECRKRLKKVVLNKGWQTREGFFKGGDWFSDIPD